MGKFGWGWKEVEDGGIYRGDIWRMWVSSYIRIRGDGRELRDMSRMVVWIGNMCL